MNDLIHGPSLTEALTEAQSLAKGKKSLRSKIPAPILAKADATIRSLEQKLGIRLEVAPSYLFYVEVSGLIVALFSDVSGIGMSREVETVREGGKNDHVHTFPGPVRYQNIVLRRGLTVSRELMNWFLEGMYDFSVKKLNMTIYQGAPGMNLAGQAISLLGNGGYGIVKQWNISNAYPVRWQLTDLSVDDTESIVFESLEVAHDGISLGLTAGTPMSATGSLI
jgi:phage tail-like protein